MGCWHGYWCFGSQKQRKRIGHAAFVPEITPSAADCPVADNTNHVPSVVFPFVAPPSSPASFLPSEPPSATQSPSGLVSFSSMSASMYSPGRPASIFATGPYAHETQLVSPPVFSTYTTEPSTAPFTPPPESVHLTTPSSPEVPFARFLDPKHQYVDPENKFPLYPCDFRAYHLQPGSSVSHLISPGSAISGSGTSSPFPDRELSSGNPHFIEFRIGDPSKLLRHEKIYPHEWGSQQGSGTLTPDAVCHRTCDSSVMTRQNSDVAPLPTLCNGKKLDETTLDHRVSFEITAEDVLRCVEKKPGLLSKAGSTYAEKGQHTPEGHDHPSEVSNGHQRCPGQSSEEISERVSAGGEGGEHHHKNRSSTLGSAKEFNFDSVEHLDKPSVGSEWWANEKVIGQDRGHCQKWSFFPMMHPDVG